MHMWVINRGTTMWVSFLVAWLCFTLPLCCSAVRSSESVNGYEGAAVAAPTPVAGDYDEPSTNNEAAAPPSQQNITLIFVVGVSICLAIFVISYCIAYRTIMVRQGSWVEHYDLFRSRARGMQRLQQPTGGRQVDDGGLDSSFVRSTLRSVPYRSAMEKKKQVGPSALQVMWAKECAVCLTEFEDGEEMKVLPVCGHCFHETCICKWLRWHSTCPICRLSLRTPAVPPPDQHMQHAADLIDERNESGPPRGPHLAVDI